MSEKSMYAALGADYDRMTRWDTRREAEAPRLAGLVDRFGCRRVLDIGCGSGLHAILLAAAGLEVTAIDLEAEMLELARAHAARAEVTVDWRQMGMTELESLPAGRFDTCLCLGNSLPHLLSDEELAKTFRGMKRVLAPDGRVVIQLLNYARVLAHGHRIVGAHREGELEFIRFYDFVTDDRLRFNILRLHWSGDRAAHQLDSTELRAWRPTALITALQTNGFGTVETFADLDFKPFEAGESANLVLVAHPLAGKEEQT